MRAIFQRIIAGMTIAGATLLAHPVFALNEGDPFNRGLNRLQRAAGFAFGTSDYPFVVQAAVQTGGNPILIFGARVVLIALSFLGLILLILFIYGGFLWMTARGEEDQVDKAKQTLTRAVIGTLIVVASWSLTVFIISKLAVSTTIEGPKRELVCDKHEKYSDRLKCLFGGQEPE